MRNYCDISGNPLTLHHKYPENLILAEANAAIGTEKGAGNLEAWATPGRGEIGIPGLAWTPHNLFPGPAPELRADDPGGDQPDTHFTRSGNVTPRSELALDIMAKGGIGKFDPDELRGRLQGLPNTDVSGYRADEWKKDPDGRFRQVGKPAGWSGWPLEKRIEYASKRKCHHK